MKKVNKYTNKLILDIYDVNTKKTKILNRELNKGMLNKINQSLTGDRLIRKSLRSNHEKQWN